MNQPRGKHRDPHDHPLRHGWWRDRWSRFLTLTYAGVTCTDAVFVFVCWRAAT